MKNAFNGLIGAIGVFLFFYVVFDVYINKGVGLPLWALALTATIAVLLICFAKKAFRFEHNCCCQEEKPRKK